MEQAFYVHQVDKFQRLDNTSFVKVHGRSLKSLKVGQSIYLTNSHYYRCTIIEIEAYGHILDEIDAMMGCSVSIEVEILHSIDGLYV